MSAHQVNTAMEAKKLLEEGGSPVEAYISAKANLRSTVQCDAVAEAQMQDAIAQYTLALQEVEKALPQVTTDEKAELEALVPAYRARVQALRSALTAVQVPPPPVPAISPVEDDAIKLLYVKGKVDDAKTRSQKIADDAMASFNAKKQQHSSTAA
mmetsp:Transcript_30939/g.99811  ORF Transcript_30939/g.99811 Transcript_30939/m.99811 type:complete len:155 (-) Transcript_30939:184-648(-)